VFQDQYENNFLFDPSSGHAEKRTNDVDMNCMTKGWGRKFTRPTLIEKTEGFIWPFCDANNPGIVRISQE
jgi:hypothetical protein